MLQFGFVCIIASAVVGVIEVIRSINDGPKGKAQWALITLAFFVGIGAVVFDVYNLPLKDPILLVRDAKARTLYFYTDSESPEQGVTIEYSLNTDDATKPQWAPYAYDDSLEIKESPTKVYYRSRFLWRTTDIQSQIAKIDEYGRVILEYGIQPVVEYKRITAEYNRKDPSDGKKGNTYVGYQIQEGDFTIIGEDPNGEEKKINGFSFSPKKLKKGKNDIEITYETPNQILLATVTVTAFEPKLLSISAHLKEEYAEGILVGTKLNESMFDVKGTYEDNEERELSNFSIEPSEILDKGNFKVTIGLDGAESTVAVAGVSEIHTKEEENNNAIEDATDIQPNAICKGTLSNEEDVDYYRFIIQNKGRAVLHFAHNKADSTNVSWNVDLLSKENDNPILSLGSTGATAETHSTATRLGRGTYYIRVSPTYDFLDYDYEVSVEFTEEDDSFETESNDDIQSATIVGVNTENPYTGNLQKREDIDYYKFSLDQKGKARIIFSHEKKNDDRLQWRIDILDNTDFSLTSSVSKGGESSVETDYFRVGDGDFYIRIQNEYNWSDIDYQVRVEYTPEDEGYEMEPNNDYPEANTLSNGSAIVGNLQSDHDIDFYTFDYTGSGELAVTFTHERFDSSYGFWEVSLFSEDSSDAIRYSDYNSAVRICGKDPESVTEKWSGLTAGKYSIKVNRDRYCNDDYGIAISW